MKRINNISQILTAIIVLLGSSIAAQSWEMEKQFDGIEIYTRSVEGCELKELKIEFSLDLNLTPIVAHLNDAAIFNDWVYNSMVFESLDEAGPGNGHFYGIVDFPWPLDDRDYVIRTSTSQDPSSKIVTIESKNAEYASRACNSEYVRIPSHHNKWTLTPISSEKTEITYWLKSDPGGAIPNWLINMAIDKGATQTIKNMISRLAKGNSDIRLAYIQEK